MHYFTAICSIYFIFCGIVRGQEVRIPGKYHGKHRILLVYAESDRSLAFQQQLREFEDHQEGMSDRDLVIFRVFPSKVVTPEKKTIAGMSSQHLLQKYNVSKSGLTVVLVGKDGGEKLTQRDFLSADQLFGIIDQMPMRKREMREKDSG